LRFIEQITVTKLLGIYISATFFTVTHVKHILTQLKSPWLSRAALDVIFNAIVLSVVTYALPSFAGQLSKTDKGRLDNLFRKALRRGVYSQSFAVDDLISAGNKKKLFHQITSNNNHCLHSLLPQKDTKSNKFS